ncbi:MAG: hypothetical protein RLQ12_22250 [Cyclobacteriaceae bacterium]
MNKKKIVIASILKPLLDPRHYERFALSLAKTNKYEVNIIANGEKKPNTPDIRFYSNGITGRKLTHRLKLRWKTYFYILKIRPHLLIVCTIELLPFAFFYSWITRCKIVYDVQENYTLNFKYLTEYGFLHKALLVPLVRIIERLSRQFVDHYFLAEKCYSEQLKFIHTKFTVLENKTVLKEVNKPSEPIEKNKLRFVFSGTVSAYAGIHKIFQIIECLKVSGLDFQFTIIGQVFDQQISSKLMNIQSSKIHIKVSESPVPHASIIEEIQQADIGVVAYQSQIVNANKVPTKLYEYVAYGLPYLIEKDSYWWKVGKKLGGAIPVDFDALSTESLVKALKTKPTFADASDRNKALWKTEEGKFLTSIYTLLE